MLIHELNDNQPCTLRLYKGKSDNLFDVNIWHFSNSMGLNVESSDMEVILMLINLEFNKDLVVVLDGTPVCFENIELSIVDNTCKFTKDVIGQYKDRRVWPRYDYVRPGIVEQSGTQIPIVMTTYDVSKYGIGVAIKEKLAQDASVLITSKCPELNKILQVKAKVRHANKVDALWHYGCSTESNDIADLVEFLQTKSIKELNNEEK